MMFAMLSSVQSPSYFAKTPLPTRVKGQPNTAADCQQTNHLYFSGDSVEAKVPKSFWQQLKDRFNLACRFFIELFDWIKQWWKKNLSSTQANTEPAASLDNWPIGRLTTEQVFGPDPSKITFRQQGGNTCYLLSALDNILHHPQCKRILAQIRFEKTEEGYRITFPGQAQPIAIKPSDIRSNGVHCDNLGIRLLEAAYFKIPDSQIQWGRFDTTNLALRRIFGDRIVATAAQSVQDYAPIDQSMQLGHLLDTEADIWTATKRVKNAEGQPINTGNHYFSIRSVPGHNDQVHLIDPFNTNQVFKTLTIPQLNEQYQAEMNRLRF
jgi:hypothetical protein